MEHIRNIAIIAHVDHGKTTLVDCLLKQSGTFRANQAIAQEERIMDSMDLEREKGITIKAKNAAFQFRDHHINIVDTPGHAAFTEMRSRGAQVTDIVVLCVAADDGIMPQTIEAIHHAKAAEVPMIIAINKVDRPDANPNRVRTELLQHDVQVAVVEQPVELRSGLISEASCSLANRH